MKPRSPKTLLPLAAVLLVLAGCAGNQLMRHDPAQVSRLHSLSVSAEQRQRYADTLSQQPRSPEAAEACYFLGQAAVNDKNWPLAEQYFTRCIRSYRGSGWDADARFMLAETLRQEGKPDKAFREYEQVLKEPPFDDLQDQARQAAAALISQADIPSLRAIEAEKLAAPFKELADLRNLQLLSEAGSLDAFDAAMSVFLQAYPQSTHLAEVQNMARKAYRAVPVNKRALGLIVPLNGRFAAFGQDVAQGVRLAVDEANAGFAKGDPFQLVVADEGSNSRAAAAAATKLIEQDKVIAIIGPVLSEAALAVSPVSLLRRVPVISPTAAKAGLVDSNPFFFRNCITNEKQARQIADRALLDMRLTRCAALYPATPPGIVSEEAFVKRVTELGGSVPMLVSFTSDTTDFKEPMLALGGIDPGIYKDAEVQTRKDIQASVESASSALGGWLARQVDLTRTALAAQATPTAKEPAAGPQLPSPTPTPYLRLAIVDFRCDTAAAAYNSGRAISSRFFYTLRDKIKGLDLQPPSAALQVMDRLGIKPDQLSIPEAQRLGQEFHANLLLGGTVSEAPSRSPEYQAFKVVAQILDAASGSIVATRQFSFSKIRPVTQTAAGPQVIYLPCDYSQAPLVADNLVFYDLKAQLFGTEGWYNSALLKNAEHLEGAQFTVGFYPDSSSGVVQRFVEAYRKAYYTQPSTVAAESYDAANLLFKGLQGVSTREDLRDALENIRDFDGVSGLTTFGGNRDAVKKLPVLEVKNGVFVEVK